MDRERYQKIISDFKTLIDYGLKVSNRLEGTKTAEKHRSYADLFFNKLLCHAITLVRISPQTEGKSEHELWDLSSACSIARCIIETHDTLGYLALNKCSDEENRFRVLVCELHDKQHRLKMLGAIGSNNPKVQDIKQKSARLLEQVISHDCYENLSNQRKKTSKITILLF